MMNTATRLSTATERSRNLRTGHRNLRVKTGVLSELGNAMTIDGSRYQCAGQRLRCRGHRRSGG